MSPRPAVTRRFLPHSPFNVTNQVVLEHYDAGDLVSHDQHGMGRLLRVESETSIVVDFGGGNVRRVTLPSAKLTKL